MGGKRRRDALDTTGETRKKAKRISGRAAGAGAKDEINLTPEIQKEEIIGASEIRRSTEGVETRQYADASRTFDSLTDEFTLDERILEGLKRKRHLIPTALQRAAIPIILNGSDCVIKSATGTGKTLAFGVPLLSSLCANHDWSVTYPCWRHQVKVIMLSPSKELAAQLAEVMRLIAFASSDVIGVWCLVEVPKGVSSLKVPPAASVLVGHPGSVYKLCQLLLPTLKKSETTLFPSVNALVMDEADLIMSVFGYREETSELFRPSASKWGGRNLSIVPIGNTTSHRAQVILASATLSEEIRDLQQLALYQPVVVVVTNETEALDIDDAVRTTASKILNVVVPNNDQLARAQIREFYLPVNRKNSDDFVALLGLTQYKWLLPKTIVFTEGVDRAYQIFLFLKAFGCSVCIASPSQSLETRLKFLQQFNQGVFEILIGCDLPMESYDVQVVDETPELSPTELRMLAKKRRKKINRQDKTSSVSRGLDFRGVCSVINFDLPRDTDIYTHRIGRAAREFYSAGLIGVALSFVNHEDTETIKGLEANKILKPEGVTSATFAPLRYRATDVLASLTPKAIKNRQLLELSEELLEKSADLTQADKSALTLLKQASTKGVSTGKLSGLRKNAAYLDALMSRKIL